MTTATVTSKGQITIPALVRQALKVEAGDRVEFVEVGPGRFEFFAATRSVKELKGMFGKAAKRVSIDDMNKAIAARGSGCTVTGLDTNVLVRYIMQDDARQSPSATKMVESLTVDEPGFVAVVSVVELGWVLSVSYGLRRDQVGQAIEGLLQTKELVVERADQVLRALGVFKATSADFADCLIAQAAASAGCTRTMTFDGGAAKSAGMTLIR